MKKRSRRAKARGKKPVAPIADAERLPVSEGSQEASHLSSEVAEAGGEGRRRRSAATSSAYDAVNGGGGSRDTSCSSPGPRVVPSVKIATSKAGSIITGSIVTATNINTTTTTSGSSASSIDECEQGSDGDGETDLSEPMHTGFMQNGPKNYRVGSTVVNLNNCSEDDVTPEFRHRDICLQVECGENTGLMYMSKLYQGSKGKCIQVEDAWYTPNEFQAVSGRESAKDWKRSIRHQGRSLKLLLSKNVLDVHPAACRCDSCRELQIMNGKPGPGAGDAGKAGSGGDTSGDDKKASCNGGAATAPGPGGAVGGGGGGKKRKKGGKQAGVTPAAKSAKITVTGAAATPASVPPASLALSGSVGSLTSSLQPVGITIPEKMKEEEEQAPPVDIPNLDSPLFKDVPSKKRAESSSDSSSSSGGSSSSDDSSSSEDDSEEDEEKKEVPVVGKTLGGSSKGGPTLATSAAGAASAETVLEPAKVRTPIKLTISNVGKPSAKVIATAAREPVDMNSSDSDTDMEDTNNSTLTEEKVDASKAEPDCEDVEEALRRALEEVEENNRTSTNVLAVAVDNSSAVTTDSGSGISTSTLAGGVQNSGADHSAGPLIPMVDTVNGTGLTDTAETVTAADVHSHVSQAELHRSCSDLGFNSDSNSFWEEEESVANAVRRAVEKRKSGTAFSDQTEISSEKAEGLTNCVSASAQETSQTAVEKASIGTSINNVNTKVVTQSEDSSEPCGEKSETDQKQVDQSHHSLTLTPPTTTSSSPSSLSLLLPSPTTKPDVKSEEAGSGSVFDRQDTKYCPDGFILAPTLSKSPEHLKSTLKVSPSPADATVTDAEAEEISNKREVKNLMSSGDSVDLKTENTNAVISERQDEKAEKPEPCKPSTGYFTDASDTTNNHISSQTHNNHTEIKDQNLNIKISNCNETKAVLSAPVIDPGTSKAASLETIKADEEVSATHIKSQSIPESSKLAAAKVDSNPSLSVTDKHATGTPSPIIEQSPKPSEALAQSSSSDSCIRGKSTSMTPPTTTTTTSTVAAKTSTTNSSSSSNSGGTMTATPPNAGAANSVGNSGSKTSGCTNGIPDSENPFITWTKYDDDGTVSGSAGGASVLNASLPASSLVQALARTPFPPLALPGDVPVPQISPLGGGVPQLSPLSLGGQLPRLSSPTATSQRLRVSPSHSSSGASMTSNAAGSYSQRTSPPANRTPRSTPTPGEGTRLPPQCDDSKTKGAGKSIKRTSRLSNIIDNLRTTKEKEVLGQPGSGNPEAVKKNSLDALFGADRKSSGLPPVPSLLSKKAAQSPLSSGAAPPSSSVLSSFPSSAASSSLQSAGNDARAMAEKLYRESQEFSQQISADTRHAIRSSLVNSFSVLEDSQDKGKRMLENLKMTKNGIVDPYGLSSAKMEAQHSTSSSSRKGDSSQPHNRIKSFPSSLSSSSTSLSSPLVVPHSSTSSSSRPSSRQSSKHPSNSSGGMAYPQGPVHPSSLSSSSPSSSSRPPASSTSSSTSGNTASTMFQAAPSAALAAAHMELNAAAANILAFQHMYGMQDPYMMKTLMSNPMYLQRMMEYQKQAMDPIMLRQLEMFEAAASAEKSSKSAASSKDRDQRAALNAQSLLWQAQAASILQHQQMQQLQQLQLHHHQQLQHQVAAVREREARDTIAAIMAGKGAAGLGAVSAAPSANSLKSNSGSISTGQSAKSVLAAAASSSSSSASKRPRPAVASSLSDGYTREGGPSLEKKQRSSHPGISASHLNNHSNYHSSSSSSSLGAHPAGGGSGSSAAKYPQGSASRSGGSGSNGGGGGGSAGGGGGGSSKHRSSSSSSNTVTANQQQQQQQQLLKQHEQQLLQQHLDLPTALQLSAAAGHNLWGFPGLPAQPPPVDIARMSRYFERPADVPAPPPPSSSASSSSTSSHHPAEPEPSGAEVLDLSVKPRTGKA